MEITIDGIKTNYQTFGEGKPFVILHGWGSNSTRWEVVAEEISKQGFKVIVPDLPGFGESGTLPMAWNMNNYTKWVEDFVEELRLGDFYLMGHSFGGALACKLSIRYPQEVIKLFLVAAASVRKKTTQKSALKNIAKIVKIFDFVPGYNLFRKAFYKFVIRRSDYPYVTDQMKETFKNVISEDLSQFTGFIRTPTIIIWGEKDKSTPMEDAQFLNSRIKNSKLVIIPGAGHALNKEYPELLVQKVLENI
jgi:pimeloyl-ACP methyl ester carboxylesterase